MPSSDAAQPANNRSRRRLALTWLAIIFLVLGIAWLLYWLIWGRFEEYTDDAYVNGNVVQLMSQVAGTVVAINTDETKLVIQGQPIIQLDPTDSDVALQRAQASLAETIRQVRQSFENAQRAYAVMQLRQADLTKAQLDLKRRVGLVGERAISQEEMQHYTTAVKAAQAQYNSAYHTLHSSLALVENTYLYTHPLVERAKANFKNAYLNKQRTVIVAPITGYVAKRIVQVGQQIAMHTAMLAIVPLNEIWVDANYKESQLSRLRINQAVAVYADIYPDVKFNGRIVGLSPGTGASFSLLPPQNATGNWIKIVQRLPVRIALDANEIKKHPLLIGLSMHTTANTHNLNGHQLATVSNDKPLYSTNVYNDQLNQANAVINRILHENSVNLFFPPSPYNKEA